MYSLYEVYKKNGYVSKKITKKNGSPRELLIPPSNLKSLQNKMLDILQKYYFASGAVHSFIKSRGQDRRNIITNASQHTEKYVVISVDIENFFDSINFGRVRGFFLSYPFRMPEKIATCFAQMTTYKNKLPQGAPTSPIISNFICHGIDNELNKLAKKDNLSYTRYADDIVVSSKKKLDNYEIGSITNKIIKIIETNGFKVNEKKTRVQFANQKQIVTGLVVNKKVNVKKRYMKQIRSMLHSWKTNGIDQAADKHFTLYNKQPKYHEDRAASFRAIVKGKINFLGQVKGYENHQYLKCKELFMLLDSQFTQSKKFKTL
jgi:RNA-directed DNA polymerase